MAQGPTKGVPIDTDGSLSANSDLLVPSEKAVVSYVTTAVNAIVVPPKIPDGRRYWMETQNKGAGTGVISIDSTSPLTTKGDIYTYDTNNAALPVQTDGMVVGADSTQPTGLNYIWPGQGTLRVLKETVFAGLAPQNLATGTTTTLDGSGYTSTVAGNGAVDIVATGLRVRNGTTSGTSKTHANIAAGNTGDFNSIVGETRFRRGLWAFWVRIASYDYTNTSSSIAGSANVSDTYPGWGVSLRRNRTLNGAPNSTTGGIACSFWYNGEPTVTSYPGVSSADVWMVYFKSAEAADVYYGSYSSGWPTMESMTLMGTIQMQIVTFVKGSASGPAIAANVNIDFGVEGSAATSGTYEIVFDRWRLTTWE